MSSISDSLSISSKASSKPEPKRRWKWNFRDDNSPKEIYNWSLYASVIVFGLTGMFRGMDEGTVSGNLYQQSFRELFGFNDPNKTEHDISNLKGNIAAMVQLGSVGGSLISLWSVDYFGRVNALRIVCLIQIVGVIIQLTSRTLGQLYVGRLIEGLGVGQTTSIGPCFLSEVAMPEFRGFIVGVFTYISNYLTAKFMSGSNHSQWMIPVAVKIIVAGLICIATIFTIESPRWLVKVNKKDKAIQNLVRLRHLPAEHPYVAAELQDIENQVLEEKHAVENYPWYLRLKDLLTKKRLFQRVFSVGIMSQLLGQWSGANTLTIYAPYLFQMITNNEGGIDNMQNTMILGAVKLVASYLACFFLLDTFGRRRSLLLGITLQGICVLYFALFLNIVPVDDPSHTLTSSEKHASQAALASLFLAGVGWVMGFNAVQYLFGPEILNNTYRGVGTSVIMCIHFLNQYANSRAIPSMMVAMKSYGAFYFMVGINVVSLIWAYLCIPELKSRSLESIDAAFQLPWYLIGRKGGQATDRSAVHQATTKQLGEVTEVTINDDIEKAETSHNEMKK
ncbi:unnamed protein product [Candida verbasci]|uniref:Major facilitator superfamily (MFS) profile domain-containing protein n=1 Tax=Candida verbasci TaxID=1227364 RepID=A0A9W4TXE0_9ASCO|nr:unnamed protein product [Candida verbasci]